MFEERYDPEEIQYMGRPGGSEASLLAIDTIVNSQNPPRRASIVTWTKDRQNGIEEHLFLFWDWNKVPLTVVHSGFASGYPSAGSRRFSEAQCMLQDRQILTNLIFVDKSDFYAIEGRKITSDMIDGLRKADARPPEWPWFELMQSHCDQVREQTFWAARHEPKLAFDFLDTEISKRCRNLYAQDVEAAVSAAFKVVEERLRNFSDKSHSFGDMLIKDVLDPQDGILTNKSLPYAEREGMLLLFRGAMKYVRNPRSHRFLDSQDEQLGIELIYLANLLLRFLSTDEVVGDKRTVDKNASP